MLSFYEWYCIYLSILLFGSPKPLPSVSLPTCPLVHLSICRSVNPSISLSHSILLLAHSQIVTLPTERPVTEPVTERPQNQSSQPNPAPTLEPSEGAGWTETSVIWVSISFFVVGTFFGATGKKICSMIRAVIHTRRTGNGSENETISLHSFSERDSFI